MGKFCKVETISLFEEIAKGGVMHMMIERLDCVPMPMPVQEWKWV
jgi:hypothetical protein